MKRYAAHYLLLPGHGFLRQVAVSVEEGVARLFRWDREVENVEWLPGVLLCSSQDVSIDMFRSMCRDARSVSSSLPEASFFGDSHSSENEGVVLSLPSSVCLYHFYPFDFTTMIPVDGTRRRRLM